MSDSGFKFFGTGHAAVLTCIAAAAAVVTAGCSLVTLGIADSLGSPDMKKITNARETGYAVSFRIRPETVTDAADETGALPEDSGNGTSFTMLTTSGYLILDIVRKTDNTVTKKMRVVEYPEKSLYALELSVPAEKNTHKRYAYAFPDEKTMSQAIGFADFYSVKGLANYLVSVKDADCARPSEDTYRDLELLTGCRGSGFKYGVDSFVNFDNGFVFPKYFTYKGPASESFSFEIEGVKNINAQKVKSSDRMMKELDRDFRQKLARGLAREADASDVKAIRKLAGD